MHARKFSAGGGGTTGGAGGAGAGGGVAGDDKIRQLQRLLLGVTKSIQTYLLEDIGATRAHCAGSIKRAERADSCVALCRWPQPL